MRRYSHSIIKNYVFILGFVFLLSACKNEPSKEEKTVTTQKTEEVAKVNYIYWNVKAILPDGKQLDVKAFDGEGNPLDIKAVQDPDQDVFLDVKAFVGNEKFPVKMLLTDEQFAPVSVVTDEGNTYDLKAITPEGEQLEVKGIRRFGNIVIMKAITKKGKYISLKAISSDGKQNDIKGIKINRGEREMTLKGVAINAHVKAMRPAANEEKLKMYKQTEANKKIKYKTDFKRVVWNVNAITTDNNYLAVKAIDPEGNMYDVIATQDSEQHSFLNIKTFVDGYELPVKIMQSEEAYTPVSAISKNGVIYAIKAITKDNTQLDVKGVSRSGRIVNIKAIGANGELFDVKAIAPDKKINHVKGIKIFDREVELKVQGHPVYAHVKALNQ